VSLFFANKAFERKPPPPKRNSKYIKQCSLFVIVPKSFFKVQIGNFKILVCNIKYFLKCPFFSVRETENDGGCDREREWIRWKMSWRQKGVR